MKTRKTIILALFALIMSAALIVFGCAEDEPDAKITFTVTANTPSDKNSDRIDINFMADVPGLNADDITLSPNDVKKVSLSGGGRNYQLAITVDGFAGTISCSVTINKTDVSTAPMSVSVINRTGKADYTLTPGTLDTTKNAEVTIRFTKSVSINPDQITIENNAAKQAALTGSGTDYVLKLSAVSAETIYLLINNTDVNTARKSVTFDPAVPPPYTPGSITKITLVDNNPKYSSGIGTNNFHVEIGFPKQLSTIIVPESLKNTPLDWISLDTSVAEVDQNGLVTAKSSSPKNTVTIVARSPDLAIGGEKEIFVNNRLEPDTLDFQIGGGKYYSSPTTATNGNLTPTTITLEYGDTDVEFKTALKNGTNLTNDQDIHFDPYLTDYITINTDSPEIETIATDVSRRIYSLKPRKVTTTDFPAGIPVYIGANYNYDTAFVKLNVKVEYASVTSLKSKTFTTSVSGGTPITGTTIDFKDAVESSKTVMYVTIEPDHPYTAITLQQNPIDHPSGTYVTPALVSGKNVFRLTRSSTWGVDTGTIKLDVIVTDMNNVKKSFDKEIELQFTS
jgi:hypothetical protein